jgi:hypothetical protein
MCPLPLLYLKKDTAYGRIMKHRFSAGQKQQKLYFFGYSKGSLSANVKLPK